MGPKMAPTWAQEGPPKRPKSTFEIEGGAPFFGFDGGKPRKTDLGAIWDPSWGPLGPSLAPLGPSWGHLGAILGHLGDILGPSWAHLGGQLDFFRAFVDHLVRIESWIEGRPFM